MKKYKPMALMLCVLLLAGCARGGTEIEKKEKKVTEGVSAVTELNSSSQSDESTEDTETTTTYDDVNDPDSELEKEEPEVPTRHEIAVENIMQMPELPFGCEIVSLTIVLNHLGFNVDKMYMCDNYLTTIDYWRANDQLYGPDPHEAFPGSPKDKHNISGCFSPVIVRAAENFFRDNNAPYTPLNTTGMELEDLLHTYIDNDIPVIIWVTSKDLHEIEYKYSWHTADERIINFPTYQHCLVMTGYDTDIGLIFTADPLVGNTGYDYYKFEQRYKELGTESLVILPKSQ